MIKIYLIYFAQIFSNNLTEISEILKKYDPKIWLIAIIVIVTYIFEGILLAKGYFRVPTRNAKRVKEAEQRGHVITAYLFKDYSTRYASSDEVQAAVYRHTVDGVEYKYNFCERQDPPQSITLFYLDDPKKTFRRDNEFVNFGCIAAVLPFILGVALTILLGVEIK